MPNLKLYTIHYQFASGRVHPGIPLKKAKAYFFRLIHRCRTKSGLTDFKFFGIREYDKFSGSAMFIPKTGDILCLSEISNPASRAAIEKLFKSGAEYLANLPEEEPFCPG